jgi:hypothetical protein
VPRKARGSVAERSGESGMTHGEFSTEWIRYVTSACGIKRGELPVRVEPNSKRETTEVTIRSYERSARAVT